MWFFWPPNKENRVKQIVDISFHEILHKVENMNPKYNSEENNLGKGNQLAENEPVVDHLDLRSWGQALHVADEDGRHQSVRKSEKSK